MHKHEAVFLNLCVYSSQRCVSITPIPQDYKQVATTKWEGPGPRKASSEAVRPSPESPESPSWANTTLLAKMRLPSYFYSSQTYSS